MQPRAGQLSARARLSWVCKQSSITLANMDLPWASLAELRVAGLETNMGVHSQYKDGHDLNMVIKH